MNKLISSLSFRTFEKLGVMPRSILRTISRFTQQIVHKTPNLAIYEFQFSRYQMIASIKCICTLLFLPIFLHFIVIHGLKTSQFFTNQFCDNNNYQYKYFLYTNIHEFEEQNFFNNLVNSSYDSHSTLLNDWNRVYKNICQSQWIRLISNFCTFLLFFYLTILSTPQLIILKSFIIEFIYNLSDTTKSFWIIFGTDLMVGFHSSKAWELVLIQFLHHFGIFLEQNYIYVIISIFPVFIDTLFKYWIFRYLNKISPSTVATYQNMIE